jgi:hypothetical protein
MDALELRSLLSAQRWDSMSAITASKLSEERATALHYYQGDLSKYMPAPAGRSKAVSMDVSDTIEGIRHARAPFPRRVQMPNSNFQNAEPETWFELGRDWFDSADHGRNGNWGARRSRVSPNMFN